jgi:hypothetical protein
VSCVYAIVILAMRWKLLDYARRKVNVRKISDWQDPFFTHIASTQDGAIGQS